MRKTILNTLFLVLTISMTSCGIKKERPVNHITKKADQKLIDESSLIFMDKDIPSHIGQILNMEKTNEGEELSSCTGSLIQDKKTILTNRHYIPEFVFKNPATCKDRLHIAFNIKGKTVLRKCKRLIESPLKTQYEDERHDYTVFELDKAINVDPLEFEINGIKNELDVSIYSVNLFNRGTYYQSKLRTNHCTAKYSPFLDYYDSHSTVATLFGKTRNIPCDIIEGNSGSALIDTNSGKAIGVVYAVFDQDSRKKLDLNDEQHAALFKASKNINKVALANPLSIISFFNPYGIDASKMNKWEKLIEKQLITAFNNTIFPGQDLSNSFKYLYLEDGDNTFKLLSPKVNKLSFNIKTLCIEKEYSKNELPTDLKVFDISLINANLEFDEFMIPSLTGSVSKLDLANGTLGNDSQGLFLEYDQGQADYIKLRRCVE